MKKLLETVLPQGKFWTHALSLVEGCTPVSPGCTNCWLSALEGRVGARKVAGGASVPSPLAPGGVFNGTVRFRADRLDLPLRAKKPRVYAIWSDLFHPGVSFEERSRALAVMALSPRHHFIIITKRPEIAARDLGLYGMEGWRQHLAQVAGVDWSEEAECQVYNSVNGVLGEGYNVGWPLRNVTILVSMEDQQRAYERAPYAASLAQAGWRVGVLCEPLLSAISFRWITGDSLAVNGVSNEHDFLRLMSWVITGGESGSKARPAHPEWVRSLRDQATAADVPFMFKQWGEWLPLVDGSAPYITKASSVGSLSASGQYRRENCVLGDDEVFVAKAGKSKAGRLLDGREWLEVPSL